MSFDWSDEEMEVNEGENDENKKLDVETINELAKQYEVSKKELDRLNQIGVEIKRALELRQKMEMCAIRADIGIKLDVKIVTVFDESILVYLDVKSDLDWILEEWDLLLSMYPISKTDEVLPCSSSSYRIPSLSPSSSQSILILQSSDPTQWPTVIRPSLVKRFTIRDNSCYTLNIPLPSLLISHLLMFKSIGETRKSGQKSSVTLPTDFFSKFIKDSLPIGMGSIMNDRVFISTEDLITENKTRIDIHSSSSSLRQSIISSLSSQSILSYSHYCPSFSPVLPIPSLQSLNALFNSIFPN